MTRPEERLSLGLADRYPPLGENVDFFYDSPDEFLAHVYFGVDVTPRVVAAYAADIEGTPDGLDWRSVLAFLDERARTDGEAVKTVIGTSFLFRLPTPGHSGYGIVDELDGELARLFTLARPHG